MAVEHFLNRGSDFTVTPKGRKQFIEDVQKSVATMDSASIARLGFGFSESAKEYIATMDAAASPQVSYNEPALSQFLQFWLPGQIRIFTQPRNAEKVMPVVQAGAFETEKVVSRTLELHGFIQTYGDLADVQRSGYTAEYVSRNVVRFQGGIQSDRLEAARMAAIQINDIEEKRAALARSFAINENYVFLYGFNGGNNRTYGFFNDPNLPSYLNVPATGTGSSMLWADKTFSQKYQDIVTGIQTLVSQTKGAFNPYIDTFTWVISPYVLSHLADTNAPYESKTLKERLAETFPNIIIEVLPELSGVNGGYDAWYIFKNTTVDVDDSTDDGNTVIGLRQQSMFMLSALPTKSGGVSENYAQAMAGCFFKRPILVVRQSGMYQPV